MHDVLQFAGSHWWLIVVVGPIVGGWIGGAAKCSERRRRDRIELERVRRAPVLLIAAPAPSTAEADAADRDRQIERILAEHDDADPRWLDVELDVATLIDHPLVTDMREPLTQAFHRAKRVADGLRPERPDAAAHGARRERRVDARERRIAGELEA